MMGAKTEEYLAALFNDSYKRELDADEAIWRSLPLFAAMLGLAVAILPSVYRSAQAVQGSSARILLAILLAMSMLSFLVGARWFWAVIRPRDYRYPPADAEIHNYAESLAAFYAAENDPPEPGLRDERVRNEVRGFLLDQVAQATTQNRHHNVARAKARTQVLLFVTLGFLVAFLCQIVILADEAVR